MQIGKKKITFKMSAAYVAKLALLTALAFALYMAKFNLPFMFPGFLEMQFSELPALLAGFSMGPVAGVLVVVFKCLLKLPLTSTMFVGELTDMLLGVVLVLPASVIYILKKDKKHAFIGLTCGTVIATLAAVLVNRYISVPFFTELYAGGNFDTIVEMCAVIYPDATAETFYSFYLGLGVVPFNLLRYIIMGALTFLLYKRLSAILHWEGSSLVKRLSGEYESGSEEETFELAKRVADTLEGGETIVLEGELGAGKTTFTKGLAAALGVTEEVTSPTFTLMNVYESGRLPLCHLDMYRLESADEVEELGLLDTAPENAVKVIEWNKFTDLTGRVINVKIAYDGEHDRVLTLTDSADGEKTSKRFAARKNASRKEGNGGPAHEHSLS